MGTMMSAAAWGGGGGGGRVGDGGADSAGLARALAAAHDSVDRIDSLVSGRAHLAVLDSMRAEIRRRTGVAIAVDSFAEGYALDRAALAIRGVADSALLNIGSQYLWVSARPTSRPVGIADPDNSLRLIASVELRTGSIATKTQTPETRGRARSVTVLAPDGLSAAAWAEAFFVLGCERALADSVYVVCADSAMGVRSTTGLPNRILLPTARAP
jgi:thiamine biosynthesis lipoprotein ApbE